MKLAALHRLIHAAETAAPEQSFDVALIGQDGVRLTVFRIDEVFVDEEAGLINIVFDSTAPVST